MTTKRPVNLNLTTIHFPVTAIISILHRATGVFLFLLIPLLLWLLDFSLSSPLNFSLIASWFSAFWLRFLVWVFMSALVYHVVAGVRHLLMDLHIGESLSGGRLGAWLVLIINFALIVLMAFCLLFPVW